MPHSPVTNELPRVLQDVTTERQRQIGNGYTPDHDDDLTMHDLAHQARVRLSQATNLASPWPSAPDHGAARRRLVEAIATLVAAVEAMDRKDQP